MIEISNKEAIYNILKTYGCSTSKQIANLIHRNYGITLTPTQIAGSMRSMIKAGQIGSSKDASGSTRYWLNEECFWGDNVQLDDISGIWRFKK